MSIDWVEILNREVEHLKESSRMLCEDNRRLRADNERLRSLLKKVGLASETYKCLFCCRYGHDADCPAFTPDGEVK